MPAAQGCAWSYFLTRSRLGLKRRCALLPETTGDRSCGPSGCEVTWLTSARLDVADDDVVAFMKLATDAGGGDGLPVVPPPRGRAGRAVARRRPVPPRPCARSAPGETAGAGGKSPRSPPCSPAPPPKPC